jgi:hypothetical protein
MFIKKKKEGGFINPAYEKFELIMGKIVFIVILILFITILTWVFIDIGAENGF